MSDFASPGRIDAARLFVTAARRFRSRPALIAEERVVTFAALLARTGRLALGLQGLGVRAGDRVVLLLPNGITFIEAWWAVVRLGAVAVPLNPRIVADDLRFVLRDTGAACVIADASFAGTAIPVLEELGPTIPLVAQGTWPGAGAVDYDALLDWPSAEHDDLPWALSQPCAIYYTAGSTGRPKGVVRSHLSVAWGLALLAQRLQPDDVLLARAPMSHTGGSLTGPFAALIAGATLVIPARTDAEAVLEAVERHRVTRLYVHPTYTANGIFARLDRGGLDLSSLRRLQWTAGPLPEAVRTEILKRFPGLPLEVTYGMTEVSNIATYEYTGGPLKPAQCVGYPWPGAEIGILAEAGGLVAPGEEGEERLLERPGADGGGHGGRLDPHRRSRPPRCGWRLAAHRAPQGRDQERRHDRARRRGRAGDRCASRRGGCGGLRPASPRVGGGGDRGGGMPRRRRTQRAGPDRALPHASQQLQGAEAHSLRRRAAAQRHGQDRQARACRPPGVGAADKSFPLTAKAILRSRA
jgi:acyl-CoA synthetase (AMP-forming)/AMP-acid ligase II